MISTTSYCILMEIDLKAILCSRLFQAMAILKDQREIICCLHDRIICQKHYMIKRYGHTWETPHTTTHPHAQTQIVCLTAFTFWNNVPYNFTVCQWESVFHYWKWHLFALHRSWVSFHSQNFLNAIIYCQTCFMWMLVCANGPSLSFCQVWSISSLTICRLPTTDHEL